MVVVVVVVAAVVGKVPARGILTGGGLGTLREENALEAVGLVGAKVLPEVVEVDAFFDRPGPDLLADLDEVLLVFGESHGHDVVVVLDGSEHALDGALAVVEDLLPLLQVLEGGLKVEALLDLLDLFLGALEVSGDVFQTLGVALPGSLGVLEQLKTGLSLVLGLVPTFLNTLDMAVQELGFAEHKIIQMRF